MATEHAELLTDLLSGTHITDCNSGIEINEGVESVFVDVSGDELPLWLHGTKHTDTKSYSLKFTLEHYYRKRGQAEYLIEMM